jgi:hypothetical protein
MEESFALGDLVRGNFILVNLARKRAFIIT